MDESIANWNWNPDCSPNTNDAIDDFIAFCIEMMVEMDTIGIRPTTEYYIMDEKHAREYWTDSGRYIEDKP